MTRRCFCGAPAKNAYRLAGTWEFFCPLDHVFDRCREVERDRVRTKPDVPALKIYDALNGKLSSWDLYEVMAQLGAGCDSDDDGSDILAIEGASEDPNRRMDQGSMTDGEEIEREPAEIQSWRGSKKFRRARGRSAPVRA